MSYTADSLVAALTVRAYGSIARMVSLTAGAECDYGLRVGFDDRFNHELLDIYRRAFKKYVGEEYSEDRSGEFRERLVEFAGNGKKLSEFITEILGEKVEVITVCDVYDDEDVQ